MNSGDSFFLYKKTKLHYNEIFYNISQFQLNIFNMNRNYIFVFILLVTTFSMINAVPYQLRKRETKFDACGAEPITVKINPDPLVSEKPATYTGSGTLKF